MEGTGTGSAEDKITSVEVKGSGRKSEDGKGIKSSVVGDRKGEDKVGSGVADWRTAVISGTRKVVDCMTSDGCNVTNSSLEDENGKGLGIGVGIIWSNGSEVAGTSTSTDCRISGCEVAGSEIGNSVIGERPSSCEVKGIRRFIVVTGGGSVEAVDGTELVEGLGTAVLMSISIVEVGANNMVEVVALSTGDADSKERASVVKCVGSTGRGWEGVSSSVSCAVGDSAGSSMTLLTLLLGEGVGRTFGAVMINPGSSDENGSNISVGKGRGVDSINTVSVANISLEVAEFMMTEGDEGAIKNLVGSSGVV